MTDVTGLELRSTVDAEGNLTLSLEEVTLTAPAAGLYLVSVKYDEPVFRGRDDLGAGEPGLFGHRRS